MTTRPTGELRVLIVDDEEDIRSLLRAILEAMPDFPCRIETASNGEQAVGLFDRFAPDVMLVDLMMPGMNGLELCKLLRARPAGAAMKIVLVTGFATVANITAAEACGANRVLSKPVQVNVLQDIVRQLALELMPDGTHTKRETP